MLIAGFIDGLNPCAFATIVFLVSYLSFLGKKNKEILIYGIIFTFGVFIAYIIAGVGLMAGLRQLSGFPMVTKGIYLVIATLAFLLGIISFYDYILFRRGQVAKMKLQLPMALKKKIHRDHPRADPVYQKRRHRLHSSLDSSLLPRRWSAPARCISRPSAIS